MINLLLLGSGKFGRKYFSTLNNKDNFTNLHLTTANRFNWKELINNKPDGIIVATPPKYHIEIAAYALERNIPAMIEKPLSLSYEECKKLKQYSVPILVNHIHLFAYQYQYIKNNIKKDNIQYIATYGQGNSESRDYNEVFDYGPHDISMILDITQQFPKSIECIKIKERVYNIKLCFDKFNTTSTVGYSDRKNRFLLANDGNIFTYNDNINDELDYREVMKDYPLTTALKVFIDAINGKTDYRLGLDLSLNVMHVLELCQKSLDQGKIIDA